VAPTGLSLTLLTSADDGDIVPARDVAMDGALLYSCDWSSKAVDFLHRRRLPLVYVDQDPADDYPSVNVDDRGGARAAARHLLDLGHRRIGLLLSSVHPPYGLLDAPAAGEGHALRQRLLGWLDELGPAGAELITASQDGTGPEQARWGARLLLDRPDRPTAVLCFSDAVAFGALQVAAELGIGVPGELSVVGFDDNPLAAQVRPGLTTVRQDVAAKGRGERVCGRVIGVPGTLEPSLGALSGAIHGPGCPSTMITHGSRTHGRHPTRLRLVPGTRSTYSMR